MSLQPKTTTNANGGTLFRLEFISFKLRVSCEQISCEGFVLTSHNQRSHSRSIEGSTVSTQRSVAAQKLNSVVKIVEAFV